MSSSKSAFLRFLQFVLFRVSPAAFLSTTVVVFSLHFGFFDLADRFIFGLLGEDVSISFYSFLRLCVTLPLFLFLLSFEKKFNKCLQCFWGNSEFFE
jgi:hypothetical protein